MNSKAFFRSFWILVILVMYSCAPVYVPNVINAPMLTNKGEVQVALHAGTSGIDPQFAWAITNNIGIMVNGSFQNSTSDSTTDYHKHSLGEIGLGYLRAIGQRGKFETFIGYGKGSIEALYKNSIWTSRSKVDMGRFFIQPTIGVTSKVIDLGLSTRISFVGITDGKDMVNRVFAEPAVTAKLGWDHLKIVGQLGISVPFNDDDVLNYQPLLFSVGIQGNFGKVFR
jgi:hypothetical protein